jgi:hypothetical protein
MVLSFWFVSWENSFSETNLKSGASEKKKVIPNRSLTRRTGRFSWNKLGN